MVAGIFLNSAVIISLWRSSQLRKNPCYFMILVLSCFDLAEITITHPLLIVSTIYYFEGQEEINEVLPATKSIYFVVCGSSLFAFFTLNVERFLPNVSIFPSSIRHKNKTSMFSCIWDGYNSQSIVIIIIFYYFEENCRYVCYCNCFISPHVLVPFI